VTVIEQAVALFRKLAADQPASFNQDLSRSLNNLSIRLSNLYHRENALVSMQEAAKIYQQLAADRPAMFEPDLTESLMNLSVLLAGVG